MKKIRFTDEARWPVAYIPSSATDITKTFARIRKQLAEQAEQEKAVMAEAQVKVRKMK